MSNNRDKAARGAGTLAPCAFSALPARAFAIRILLATAVWMDALTSGLAALAPGPDAFGYSATRTAAFAFTNIAASATKVLNFDDDTSVTVNLGFAFNFYGSNYTAVSLNPNGLMTFGGASMEFSNVNLTTTATASNRPCLAVLWDDWETESVGADAVYYQVLGSAGSRQFIVQWNQVMVAPSTAIDTVTFQARLFEGVGQILFSYLDAEVSDDAAYTRGLSATVGLRDRSGHANGRSLLWSHNQSVITNGLNILFTRANRPPLAADDLASTGEDQSVTINVLANDSDPDGHPLTVIAAGQATNGAITINGATNVTYSPNFDFNGLDGFTYLLSDGQGGTATGRVTVTVTLVNDGPPVAGADSFHTYQDVALRLTNAVLLANDTDVDRDDVLQITGVSAASASGGAVTLETETAAIQYTPPVKFLGVDHFSYTVSDGRGGSATGAVAVTVWPPPQVRALELLGGDRVRLRFDGLNGRNHDILVSLDLLRWVPIAACCEVAPGVLEFEDAESDSSPWRFYRLLAR